METYKKALGMENVVFLDDRYLVATKSYNHANFIYAESGDVWLTKNSIELWLKVGV